MLFRGQKLAQEDLLRVTGYFGQIGALARPPKFFPKGYARMLPDIMMISNIRENGEPIGALPDGEMMFHHDMIHAEMPHNGTLLYSVEIPTTAATRCSPAATAAYDTLDPDDPQTELEGRRALHHYNYGSTQRGDGRHRSVRRVRASGVPHPRGDRPQGGLRQPADDGQDRRHAARRRATSCSNALFDHAEKPEFVYEHVWRARRPAAVGQPLLDACARRISPPTSAG